MRKNRAEDLQRSSQVSVFSLSIDGSLTRSAGYSYESVELGSINSSALDEVPRDARVIQTVVGWGTVHYSSKVPRRNLRREHDTHLQRRTLVYSSVLGGAQ